MRPGRARRESAAQPHERPRPVDGEHGRGAPVPFVDGQEAAVAGVALDDAYGVLRPGPAGELEARSVLVRPEVRQRLVPRDGAAREQVAHGGVGLFRGASCIDPLGC